LNAQWISPPCSTITVSSRHHWPDSAMAAAFSAPSRHRAAAEGLSRPNALPLSAAAANSMKVLMPSRVQVASGRSSLGWPRTRTVERASSGHSWPTGAGLAHSPQIGRSQREQRRPVCRSGCR
jgi:hypothetical protein